MYPNENFEMQENNTGWRFRFGGTGDFANYVSVNNYLNKPLFFEGHNSWLTDSSDNMGPYLCSVYYIGQFIYQKFNEKALGARPVVSIPKSVFDQLVGN